MRGLDPITVVARDHDLDGIRVRETVLTDGPVFETPLLFVHGRCHGGWAYERWLHSFATAGWRALAISLRGHPPSARLAPDVLRSTTFENYLDDLTSVMRWLASPPAMLGHSLGGILVQKLAETANLPAIVLMASVGPSQLGRHAADFPLDALVDDADVYQEKGQPEMVQRVCPESPVALNAVRGRMPIERERIRCPVLVVGAGRDDTGVHDPAALAAFYQCELLIVRDATHDLMLDDACLRTAAGIAHWCAATLHPEIVTTTRPGESSAGCV